MNEKTNEATRQPGSQATRKCHGMALTTKAVITVFCACVTLWHCTGCAQTESVLSALAGDLEAGIANVIANLCEGAGH